MDAYLQRSRQKAAKQARNYFDDNDDDEFGFLTTASRVSSSTAITSVSENDEVDPLDAFMSELHDNESKRPANTESKALPQIVRYINPIKILITLY